MDGQAVEEVTAVGVEGGDHRRHPVINRFKVLNELISGNAPSADLAIDIDLNNRLFGLRLCLDSVPVLVLDR
ncbi:hypothetical protein D3C81_1964960 [compost metagenome]